MNYKSPLCSCIVCHETKSVKGIFSHYFSNHDPTGIEKMSEIRKKGTNASFADPEFQKKFSYKTPKNLKTNSCLTCNKEIKHSQKFCSNSCATITNNKKRVKKSKPILNKRKYISKYCPISFCIICNAYIKNDRRTCSKECYLQKMREAGKKSASIKTRRSKDEIKLFELCHKEFPNVKSNIVLVDGWDADIILLDQKIAILWNGPWHYKQMPHKNHSLKQVQTRDSIKIKTLQDFGWNVLIYEDRHFTPETAFQDIMLRALESN